ncbi:MAG: futalosine hydrolase [Actinobacteria bacterium]|nr:futalosine hydrolase [Actinomycetota bacterium]
MLRRITEGCRVILVAATEAEAAPLLDACREPRTHVVATKTFVVGEYPSADLPSGTAPRRKSAAAPSIRAALAISGCDKTNAAHVLTCLLQIMEPAPLIVVQVGIAGALPGAGSVSRASVGDVVLATSEAYSDTGSSSPSGWLSAQDLGLPIARPGDVELGGSFFLDPGLVLWASEVIEAIDWADRDAGGGPGIRPAVLLGPCVTASRVTGTQVEAEEMARRWAALAESMEGAAAAHICALYQVSFLEIRGISNLVTDRDRDAWKVDRAVEVAGRAALAVVGALGHLRSSGGR